VTKLSFPLDTDGIRELLPHRDPFLMLDEIVDCVPGESVTAIKRVSAGEPHFAGHFPGNPVMPGVLIIEAMAQAGGVLSHVTNGDVEPRPLYMLARVEEARFRRPVVPGDELRIRVTADKVRRGMWWYECAATVAEQVVAEATIVCAPGESGA
jgi:3-hydroxyacyl-[acyl-carrier-protein] dehydratase